MSLFDEVRARVRMSDAIDYLSLKPTEQKGDQLRFPCPHCKGNDRRTLSVNTAEDKFRCFTGGKGGTDATAFVAHCQGISQTEAAKLLASHFLTDNALPRSSTKPAATKPKADGRSESPAEELRPLELLGISDDLVDRLHILVEDGRVLFEQRDERGIKLGMLALATRDDLPLVEWIAQDEPKAEGLRGLWRVVKGGT